MIAKYPARHPAKYLAANLNHVPAMAGQWQRQCRRTSGKATRKITCVAPDMDVRCPRRKLARQLATQSRDSRATVKATSRKATRSNFNHDIQKIMNTPVKPTPDLEGLRKAVQEFRPNLHRVPFNNLKPIHDSIVELRRRKISYASIADLLIQHGVGTSRARVAEYGRIVLDGGRKRKRRKRAKIAPVINVPATPQSAPAVAAKPAPTTAAPAAVTNNVPPPAKESSPYTSRGPHIANVRMMSPEEKADFDAFLKAKNAPKS